MGKAITYSEGDNRGIHVSVGWTTDGNSVTVGAVSPESTVRIGDETYTGEHAGIFVSLDRDGLDELIENLTHARRKAFGKVLRPRSTVHAERQGGAAWPAILVGEPPTDRNEVGDMDRTITGQRLPIKTHSNTPPSEDLSEAASSL